MRKNIAVIGSLVWALAATAQAQDEGVIVVEETVEHSSYSYHRAPGNLVYSERSLILDSGTIRLDLAPADRGLRTFAPTNRLQPGFVISKTPLSNDHFLDLNVGLAVGIGDVVELGAVAPIALHPDNRPDRFGDPAAYIRAGLAHGPVQIAGQAGIIVPANDNSEAVVALGVPIKFQLGPRAHITTGATVYLTDLDDDVDASFYAPLELAGNVTDRFFVGVNSGVGFDLAPDEGDNGFVPVGAFAGYTFPLGRNNAIDLQASFTFTDLVGFGASRGDTVNEESYQIIVGGTLYGDVVN